MTRTMHTNQRGARFTMFGLIAVGSMLASCTESVDNFNSTLACQDYCDKDFDCDDMEPTNQETSECVSACRDSIEDECGNEHQAEANDKIGDCTALACGEFRICMVFEAAPECYGFAN